jgi:hypothetical protein
VPQTPGDFEFSLTTHAVPVSVHAWLRTSITPYQALRPAVLHSDPSASRRSLHDTSRRLLKNPEDLDVEKDERRRLEEALATADSM